MKLRIILNEITQSKKINFGSFFIFNNKIIEVDNHSFYMMRHPELINLTSNDYEKILSHHPDYEKNGNKHNNSHCIYDLIAPLFFHKGYIRVFYEKTEFSSEFDSEKSQVVDINLLIKIIFSCFDIIKNISFCFDDTEIFLKEGPHSNYKTYENYPVDNLDKFFKDFKRYI